MDNKYYFLKSSAPDASNGTSRGAASRFSGLDMNGGSGSVAAGINFEITSEGTIRTASIPKKCNFSADGVPLGFLASGKYLYIASYTGDFTSTLTRIMPDADKVNKKVIPLVSGSDNGTVRSLALYSKWTGGSDIVSGKYEDVLLIFPDKKSISAAGVWASDTKPEAIARYDITRTVSTETVITERTYNNGTWQQNDDGTYVLPAKADGTKRDIDTKSQSSFYGSQSVDTLPKTVVHPTAFSTVYTKEEVHGTDGSVSGTVLYVTETAVTVKETFSAEEATDAIPEADKITVHNTRLFGADGSKIFASGAGSYSDYELDTAEDFDENNAWYSATAGDAFTALTVFDGRVTAFKPQGLYLLYNTKNPFRIKEISKVGTSFGDTVCETESILYYANETGIYAFNGSYPKNISLDRLDMARFTGTDAESGAFGGKYYFRRETDFDDAFAAAGTKPVFVYDSHTGTWSIISFTTSELYYYGATEKALYALDGNGDLWRHESDNRSGVKWYYELPAEYGNTADVKKLMRIQAVFHFRSVGKVTVSAALDNGDYVKCGSLEHTSGRHAVYFPILSGDHVVRRLRFEGTGDVELTVLEQILGTGGIRYGQ